MYIYNLNDKAKKLKIDYEGITSKISHNVLKGTSREELLKQYLIDLIPDKCSIGSGIIVDSSENQSKQQDFFVYNSFDAPPIIKYESFQVIPIESVFCTIEIKSSLTSAELKKCVDNVQSVRKLEKQPYNNTHFSYENSNNTVGFVFAYSSNMSLRKIRNELEKYNDSVDYNHQISAICILNKGLILNVNLSDIGDISLYPSSRTILAISSGTIDDNFYNFYLMVLTHIMTCHFFPPNLMEYATKAHKLNLKPSVNINDLSDDLYLGPSSNISVKGIKELSKQQSLVVNTFKKKLDFNDFCKNVIDVLIPFLYLYKEIDHRNENIFFIEDINIKINLLLYEQINNCPEQLNTMLESMYDFYSSK